MLWQLKQNFWQELLYVENCKLLHLWKTLVMSLKGRWRKNRKNGSFQRLLQQEPKMICLQIYSYGKPWWWLDSTYQSFPGASAPRQSWHVWRSISRYSVQLVLNARKATELQHRHSTAVDSLLPSPASSAPQPVQGLHGKLKLVWELAFMKMIDSGTPTFPSINSGKWKSSC